LCCIPCYLLISLFFPLDDGRFPGGVAVALQLSVATHPITQIIVTRGEPIMNKKLLLASTVLAGMVAASVAQAADLAPVYKAPPQPVVAPAMWTGFYIGAHVGGGWGTKEWSEPFFGGKPSVNLASFNVNGPLAGGQIGYNWQSGWVVFGVEADA